ncbi:MAG TPA: Tad domain-containing protein [Pyrinomonadaceae bacterium]|nr:Tad domain-containing protein [Pyrinomonadaceae bacterium]
MSTLGRRNRKGERGSILATSAIGMLSVLLAVGLGVDISRFYLAKSELQNAADAAALAGVSGLNSTSEGIIEAGNRAVQTMNGFNFNNQAVTFPRTNVVYAKNLGGPYISEGAAQDDPKDIRFVQVTTPPSAVPVSFAMSVLGSSKNLSATATAGYSVPLNVPCNWLPAFVLDDPENPISPNNLYTFRLPPGNHVSPGNYQLLSPEGPGGSDTRTGMANGVSVCAKPGDKIPTKTGETAGAVRQGINTRFDIYQGPVDPDVSPPDTNVAPEIDYLDYRKGTPMETPSHPGVAGRRVVIIPISLEPPGEGRDYIVIDRFGVFFLQSPVGGGNGGDLKAEYVGDPVLIGNGTYDPAGGPASTLLAVPVLYK